MNSLQNDAVIRKLFYDIFSNMNLTNVDMSQPEYIELNRINNLINTPNIELSNILYELNILFNSNFTPTQISNIYQVLGIDLYPLLNNNLLKSLDIDSYYSNTNKYSESLNKLVQLVNVSQNPVNTTQTITQQLNNIGQSSQQLNNIGQSSQQLNNIGQSSQLNNIGQSSQQLNQNTSLIQNNNIDLNSSSMNQPNMLGLNGPKINKLELNNITNEFGCNYKIGIIKNEYDNKINEMNKNFKETNNNYLDLLFNILLENQIISHNEIINIKKKIFNEDIDYNTLISYLHNKILLNKSLINLGTTNKYNLDELLDNKWIPPLPRNKVCISENYKVMQNDEGLSNYSPF